MSAELLGVLAQDAVVVAWVVEVVQMQACEPEQ
jgi:hypothetical protein